MKSLRSDSTKLDSIDAAIVEALAENGRISLADLARHVGLSSPSVSERVKRLEEAAVITGYGARVDPAALGYAVSAWLRIRPIPGQLHKVVEILQGLPEIISCDRVTGEDCFIARAHVGSMEDLEALIDEIIPFAMTNTSIVQSTPVLPRLPPIPTSAGQPFRASDKKMVRSTASST